MSEIIEPNSCKINNRKAQEATAIHRFKHILYEDLSKISIVFTPMHEAQSQSKFHCYTLLDPIRYTPIQLCWSTAISNNNISINVVYSTCRTLGFQAFFKDERTKIQINIALRLINLDIPCYLTFKLDQKGEISVFYEKYLQDNFSIKTVCCQIRAIIDQIRAVSFQKFSLLLPFISCSIDSVYRKSMGQEDRIQYRDKDEKVNVSYLSKLKNSFDRYKKNRDRATIILCEQRDQSKIKKKMEDAMCLLRFQLTVFSNAKYSLSQYRPHKILQNYQIESNQLKNSTKRKEKIAYQFQILHIKELQKQLDTSANSKLSLGKYNYRIFKTIIQKDLKKSQSQKYSDLSKSNSSISEDTQFSSREIISTKTFDNKDIIEQRVSYLVKKQSKDLSSQKALKNQINFLKFVRNQICKFIPSYYLQFEANCKQLFVDYFEQSLGEIINQNQANDKLLSFESVLLFLIKIAEGIKFINYLNICHRDIKPSNIMISSQFDPKIIDFGSIISIYNQKSIVVQSQTLCGTKHYFFPYEQCPQYLKQMFLKSQYEAHALFDVYSFGVIAEKLLNYRFQRQSQTQENQILKYMTLRCKEANPDNRLCFDEILCILYAVKNIKNDKF